MARALVYWGGRPSELPDGESLEGVPVTVPAPPPSGTANRRQYFSALLGSSGANGGTTNQNVNGSGAPQEFYIGASADYDIHVMRLMVVIADSAVRHNRFGNIMSADIANGWDLTTLEDGNTTYLVQNGKTSGQVLTQLAASQPFGNGGQVFTIPNYTDTSDAILISFEAGAFVPNGIRIGRGNTDRLGAVVNDDFSGLEILQVRAFGFKNIPEAS